MNNAITGEDLTRLEETTIPVATRYHYMDNLRALAMLAGIFFHAALAYSPTTQAFWFSADSETSLILDVVAWFSHMFRMPLFFVIAGFFSIFLFEKRGLGGMLKNRALRVLLPLAVFLPMVMALMIAVINYGVSNVANMPPMLQFIASMAGNPDAPPPPLTTAHLWFLLNLCWFYIAFALLQKTGFLGSRIFVAMGSRNFIVFGLPLLMAPAFATLTIPHPAPEQFTPQWWSFATFGLFFLFGASLFKTPGLLERLKPWTPYMLVVSLAAYAVIYQQMPGQVSFEEMMAAANVGITPGKVGVALLEAMVAVYMTIVCLVAGQYALDSSSRVLRYVADSSYWVYIIHLPVLFFVQMILLDSGLPLLAKYLVGSFGTLAIGFVTYALLVRWTPIGWMLNGRRKKHG